MEAKYIGLAVSENYARCRENTAAHNKLLDWFERQRKLQEDANTAAK